VLQPENLLTKRGTLLSKEPRVDQKVFATISFPDFAFGISVIFSDCCPATVSDSETVFLCPLRPFSLLGHPSIQQDLQHIWAPLPLAATVAAAIASARTGSRLLRHG
jgi:hypothetical protein